MRLAEPYNLKLGEPWPGKDKSSPVEQKYDLAYLAAADYQVAFDGERRKKRSKLHVGGLAKGGQARIFRSKQRSLLRTVAVKIGIDPAEKSTENLTQRRKRQWEDAKAEALITGHLEHPNVVPIYDIAKTEDGKLFYSMKLVTGETWEGRIVDRTCFNDNLDVFLKVCDALAFAHSRHIVHRDLKPANVMLGEYGEVYVMDWGMSIALPGCKLIHHIPKAQSPGGTPEYMAPELAGRDIAAIDERADIYLLGALLFQIIIGFSPRPSARIDQKVNDSWVDRVKRNLIEYDERDESEIDAAGTRELFEVALKAMETSPEDRYQSVQELRKAVVEYRRHEQSVKMARRAQESLEMAMKTKKTEQFALAMFGYEEALQQWDAPVSAQGNGSAPAASPTRTVSRVRTRIEQSAIESRLKYALQAEENQNFELGLSLLKDRRVESYGPVVQRLESSLHSAKNRLWWVRFLTGTAVVLLAGLAIVFSYYLKLNGTVDSLKDTANQEQAKAVQAKTEAAQAMTDAGLARDAATTAKTEAERANTEAGKATETARLARESAETARNLAEIAQEDLQESNMLRAEAEHAAELAQQLAEAAKSQAIRLEYEGYVAVIRRYCKYDQLDEARDIKRKVENDPRFEKLRDSEFKRLCTALEIRDVKAAGKIERLATSSSPNGLVAIAPGQEHALEICTVKQGKFQSVFGWGTNATTKETVTAVAFSPNGRQLAFSTGQDRDVKLRLFAAIDGSHTFQPVVETGLQGTESAAIEHLVFINDQYLAFSTKESVNDVVSFLELWKVDGSQLSFVGREDLAYRKATDKVEGIHLLRDAKGKVDGIAAVVNTFKNPGRICFFGLKPENSAKPSWSREGDTSVLHWQSRDLKSKTDVTQFALSPDGNWGASCDRSAPGRVLLWDARRLRELATRKTTSARDFVLETTPLTNELDNALVLASVRGTGRWMVPALTRRAHHGVVRSLCFSPDGKTLLTGGDDFRVKEWAVGDLSPHLKAIFRGHSGPIQAFAVLDDTGHQFLSFDTSGRGQHWSHEVAQAHFEHNQIAQGPPPRIPDVDIKFGMEIGESEVAVRAIDFNSAAGGGLITFIVAGEDEYTSAVPLGPDGTYKFESLPDPGVSAPRFPLAEGSQKNYLSMAIDRNERWLVTGGVDGIVRIWDLKARRECAQLPRRLGLDLVVAISPDGRQLLVAGNKEVCAELWNLDDSGKPAESPRLLLPANPPNKDSANAVAAATTLAISPDGLLAFAGDRQGNGRIWSIADPAKSPIDLPVRHKKRLNAAAFVGQGKQQTLLVGGDDRQICEYSTDTGTQVGVYPCSAHGHYVTDLAVSFDGRFLVAVVEPKPSVELKPGIAEISVQTTATNLVLWDRRDKEAQGQLVKGVKQVREGKGGTATVFEPVTPFAQITSVQFAPNSSRLLTVEERIPKKGMSEGNLTLWTLPEGNTPLPAKPDFEQLSLNVPYKSTGQVNGALFLENGTRLATLHGSAVHQWKLDEKGLYLNMGMLSSNLGVYDVSCAPAGGLALTASPYSGIKAWNLGADSVRPLGQMPVQPGNGGYRCAQFAPTQSDPNTLIFAAASSLVATGEQGIAIEIRSMHPTQPVVEFEKRPIHSLASPLRRVASLRYSPNGQLLAACGSDNQGAGVVVVWKANDFSIPGTVLRHTHATPGEWNHVAVSCDGHWVAASGGEDKSVRVWNLTIPGDQSVPHAEFKGHSATTKGVEFYSDPEVDDVTAKLRLVSCAGDGTKGGRIIWKIPPLKEEGKRQNLEPVFGDETELKFGVVGMRIDQKSGRLILISNGMGDERGLVHERPLFEPKEPVQCAAPDPQAP
ncbi:MAG: protein kinase [Planctomycetota bacterium]|nr:protein kinase [Planctomycetota bacterium]